MHLTRWVLREARQLAVLRTRPSWVAAWVGLNLLLFIALIGALGYRAELERREAQTTLKTAAITLASSYAEQVSITVATVDEQTLTLRHYAEEGRAQLNLLDQWNEGLFGARRVNGAAIADKDGNILTSTIANSFVKNIATLPMFGQYKSGELKGLHIFPPSLGMISNRSIIRFMREVRDARGEFNGIISIGCLPSYFLSSSVEGRLGEQDYLSILGTDGTVYVRQTREGIGSGHTMFVRPFMFEGAPGFRAMTGSEFTDGVSRYVAWAPIAKTQLFALSGLSIDDALVNYRQSKKFHSNWATAWGALLTAICIAGLVLYGRLLLRANEAERIKRTYRLATEGAGEGFYMLESLRDAHGTVVDFSILDCNALGAQLMDFGSADLIGKKVSELHASQYGAQLIGLFKRALERGYDDAEVRLPASSRYNVEWINRKMVATEGSLAITVIDISEKKRQEKALRDSANHDALTGLPNRYWLTTYLPKAVDDAQDANTCIALFFVDLDNFKDINDTFGHYTGDLVLQEAAARLQMAVRPQDTVIRLGGDEFTVLIEGIENTADIQKLVERIIFELGRPVHIEGKLISMLNGSIGISCYPNDARDSEELLQHADVAMYVAKANGKMCFAFYTPEIGRLRVGRLEVERELREAIANRDFVVHFQPRLNIRSGVVVGAEALVRWRHPTKGLIKPDQFIELAEQTGLILEVGEIVVELVCDQLEEWVKGGALMVPISVNVSPIQLNRRNIAALVIENIQRRAIPSRFVEIEMTEAAMLESKEVHAQLSALRAFGIKLLVDDFGTGYSSLAQMQYFHLDVLKIDQSLTAKLGKGPEAEVVYAAIVAMGHAMGMSITAEGVETEEQLKILGELRCDDIQGFLIVHPLPGDLFQEFLMRSKG